MRPPEPRPDGPVEPQRTASRRPPILALIAISALSPFAINAVLPSMPAIELAFDTSYSRVQLVLSLFLASIAISQIFIGPLSDQFGRRPVLLGGFAIFIGASIAATVAPTIEVLIGIRVVQGAAGCVGIVLGRAIVRDLFERRRAAAMLGYVTMGLAIAPMLAPSIGGVLQQLFDWRAVYWFMAVFGAACLFVTWRLIPETNLRPSSELSLHSLFTDYRRLLGERDFLLFSASSSLSSGVFFSFLGGAPYVSEHVLNLTPAVYGLWFATAALGYSAGSFLAARFTDRFGVVRMILGGSALALFAALLPILLFEFGLGGPSAMFLPMVITGMANGLTLPSAISGAVSVRPEIAGAAAGLSGAAQIGTGAVLSAATGAVLAGGTSAYPMFVLMMVTAALALLAAIGIYRRNRR